MVVEVKAARGLVPIRRLGAPLRCKAGKLKYPLRIPPEIKKYWTLSIYFIHNYSLGNSIMVDIKYKGGGS